MSTADRLIDAAIARLARGDGRGSLQNLGIHRTEVISDAGVGSGSLYHHFPGDDALRDLADEVMDRLLQEQVRLREEAVIDYRDRAEFIADGAGRKTIAKALLAELKLYGAVPDDDPVTRARERLYYLGVALCDGLTSRYQLPITSEIDEATPEHRFRRHVIKLQTSTRVAMLDVYAKFLAAANREPIHDIDRLERVLSSFIEGVLLIRRVVVGHGKATSRARDPADEQLVLDDEELIDAVLRIFLALSRPTDGTALDPDAVLFGRQASTKTPSAGEMTLYRDRETLYETIIGVVDQLPEEAMVSHCALHTSGAKPRLTKQGNDLLASVNRFTDRGGELRNIEKIDSLDELDQTIDWLRGRIAAQQKINFKALVMDSPPGFSPLLLGKQMAYLGREEDGVIVDAVGFSDETGRSWCEDHFEVLWRDARSYPLASPNGLNPRGIDNARMQLEALERRGP